MKVLIDISEKEYNYYRDASNFWGYSKLREIILNGTPLPEGATNGEALCMLFPNMHYTLSDKSPRVVTTLGVASSFDMNWWNAPYKKEVEE